MTSQRNSSRSDDLRFRDLPRLPHVHPFRDCEQEFVDVSERAQTMAILVQVTKKGTPLFSKPAHLVNAHPITAFHQLVKHLADSLE